MNALYLYQASTGVVDLHINGVGHTFTPPSMLNKWSHIAIARSGNITKLFVDGVQYLSFTDNTNYVQGGTFYISRYWQSDNYNLNGYIRDFRWVKGTAVYTSAFTPPTELSTAITNTKLLINSLPYFKDQSASNHTITAAGNAAQKAFSLFDNSPYSEASHGASAYFDGTGDYLTAPDHADFNMGSENFTAECWIYPTASPSQPIIMGQWSGSYSWALEMSNNSSRYLRFLTNAGSIVDNVSSTAVPLNQWSHVALVRNGTSFVAYLNGTSVVSSTVTGALTNSTDALSIGC